MVRVLQTLALPLGHDAMKTLSGRWDSNPRPSPWQGDVLPLYYARIRLTFTVSAETQNRTVDTAIFSRVLYQLSYLGDVLLVKRAEFYFGRGGLSSNACQACLKPAVSFIAYQNILAGATMDSSRPQSVRGRSARRDAHYLPQSTQPPRTACPANSPECLPGTT